MSLQGRRAVITGAGGHLGRTFAATLAEMGADLVLVDRDEAALIAAQDSLRAQGAKGDITLALCELESQAARRALIDGLLAENRDVNILINNAAFVGSTQIEGWAVPFEQQSIDTWRRAIEVNLTAAFELCQGLAPLMRRAVGANIINIASIYGEYGPNWALYEGTAMSNPAAYGASKGGLIQLTRWLATTIAPQVRVNAISPGGIARGQPDSFAQAYVARTPLQRMGSEADFAGAVAFLASDMSAYVTGQILTVDGGWGVW